MDRQTPLVQLLKSTSTIIPSSNNANLDTFMFETPLLAELTKKITELYKDDLVFALLFGSRVDGEFKQNSDYDILIVEKSPYKDQSRHEQIKRIFIELQEKEELKVDYDYPGEYIDIFTLNKAILGYGFVYDDKEVIIEKVGAKDWNRFNEYRQWLSAMSGPNILLAGNIKDFVEYKERAIKTLIKLVICKRDFTFKDSSELVDLLVLGGKEYLGMKNIPSVRKYLEDLIELVLHELIQENIIIKGDNKFHVNFEICVKSIELLISTDENEFRKSFFGGITDFDKQVITDVVSDNLSYVSSLNKTIDYRSDKDLQEDISEDLPMDAMDIHNVQKQYADSVRKYNINQANPNYIAFPDSGNSISGLVGNINEIFANQNLIATTKSAPSGTFVEIQTIEWFRKLVGYPVIGRPEDALGAGGAFVFGGTMANTISLMAAREKAFPGCKKKGLTSFNEKPVLLVAENTINHYSHAGAFGWLGLGEDNIVEVSITEDFRLDQNDLKKKLKKYKNDSGYKIIALVAQAGDSRTTTIEDFDAISKITKQFGVWLHVDACHGGVLIFSNKHKHKLKGMELADSISMDPHKGLAVTYPASLVLVKDRESLGLIAKHTDITINKGSFDLGQMTPMIGSKPFIALKLWFLIKSLGIKNIGKIIDSRMDLAQSWKRKIDDSKYFRSLNDIELNSVVFSLCPKKIKTIDDSKKLSELNKALHDAVYKDGYMCIHNFDIVDYKNVLKFGKVKIRTLGAIFGNPLTDEYDFNAYINYLESVAERYIR